MHEIMDSWYFTWVLLPGMIFLARVADVSIGTLRLIFISKGFRIFAPLLGFFEVIIWLLAIRQIMQHMDNFAAYLAYGLGFATGNYIGMILDDKISLGKVILRVIPKAHAPEIIRFLREQSFGVTAVEAEGKAGKVKVIFSTMKKKDLKVALGIINQYDPQAFYTIEDVTAVKEGYFRAARRFPYSLPFHFISPFSFHRKGR